MNKNGWGFIILMFMLVSACGIIESDEPSEIEPGPRNYVWSEETFDDLPGGYILDFWGSAPDDIWALRGGQQNLWHYNGEEWNVWPESIPMYPRAIFGVAPDNIYLGAGGGRIYNYNGKSWELNYRFEKDEYRISDIKEIWGESASDLYAIGLAYPDEGAPPYYSFILHYDGDKWSELLLTDFDIQFQRIRGENGKIYVHGIKPSYGDGGPRTEHIYRYASNQLHEIFKKSSDESGSIRMNNLKEGTYFLDEKKIYRPAFADFTPIKMVEMPVDPFDITGRNVNDLFLNSRAGIFHYNGENTVPMIEISENQPFKGVRNYLIFENEVFFNVVDMHSGDNIFYHGRLEDS